MQGRLVDRTTVLDFNLEAPLALARLRLETPVPAFLKGATVELYDSTGSGLLNATTTADGGSYSFAGLAAGTYQMCPISTCRIARS